VRGSKSRRERGSILAISVFLMLLVAGMALAYMTVSQYSAKQIMARQERVRAQYVAEAGLQAAMRDIDSGGTGAVRGELRGGRYQVAVLKWDADKKDNDGDGQVDESDEGYYQTFKCTGIVGRAQEHVEIVLAQERYHPLFYRAIYAGNWTKDGSYQMKFGGGGTQEQQCARCGGTGTITTTTYTTCPTCKGTGTSGTTTTVCPKCGGAGKYQRWGRWRTCTQCGGTGTVTTQVACTDCNGMGQTRTGTKTEPCPDCKGTGTQTVQVGGQPDRIDGDIYCNGDVVFDDGSYCGGKVEATGAITGNAAAEEQEGADRIDPPDLQAMDYEHDADFKVTASGNWSKWVGSGSYASYAGGYRLPESDPGHIFVKDLREDLGIQTDLQNFFMEDPYAGWVTDRDEPDSPTYGKSQSQITLAKGGNDRTYFVDGNLWIEPHSYSLKLKSPTADGTHITIVARGNIFVCDGFYYEKPAKDGICFIALGRGESFTDVNHNKKYDPGEPILHDNGNGVYDGPSEGSGNIYFGDPNVGPMGTMYSYYYAENNFYDHVLDRNSKPLDFKIIGSMSAGNLVDIHRDMGGEHAQLEVDYDTRLEDGGLALPGLPKHRSTTTSGWSTLSWRPSSTPGTR